MTYFPIRHYKRDSGDALPPPDSSDEDELVKLDESTEIAIPDQDDNVEVVESKGAAGS